MKSNSHAFYNFLYDDILKNIQIKLPNLSFLSDYSNPGNPVPVVIF